MSDALTDAIRWEVQRWRDGQMLRDLHPLQRAFVSDSARRKTALCSRRAGKSHGIAAWLVDGARRSDGTLSLYIAQTRNNCRLIFWSALEDLERLYHLGLRLGERDGQLMCYLPNGSSIWMAGCKDSSETEKFRGPKYRRVAIDEAQSLTPYLSTLVYDAIEPALVDLRGELALTGTPGPIAAGMFYDATTDTTGQWSRHSWTWRDNPHVPDDEVERIRVARSLTLDDPTWQREYEGQWVRDESAMVYPYDAHNLVVELPELSRYVIGVDPGYVDPSGVVVVGHQPGDPRVYVVEAHLFVSMSPTRLGVEVGKIRQRYPHAQLVVDEGGLGKGYAQEWRERHQLPAVAADKHRRTHYLHSMRDAIRAGNVLVHAYQARSLLDEWAQLQWDPSTQEIPEGAADHVSDAALYAWRHAHSTYHPTRESPRIGTQEWYDRQEKEMLDSIEMT